MKHILRICSVMEKHTLRNRILSGLAATGICNIVIWRRWGVRWLLSSLLISFCFLSFLSLQAILSSNFPEILLKMCNKITKLVETVHYINTLFIIWKHFTYIHTYIIGHYNPSVRIIDLVTHTTYVVCVNFKYISGGIYSLKSNLNDRFFEKLFMAIFICS